MSRIVLSLGLAMVAVQAVAQDQLPMDAPNEVRLNELPVSQGEFQTDQPIAETQPIMTSFPMAVPPTIQFGNQCPHECNPCNLNLWANYCAEKRLWCQKCQPACCPPRCHSPCLLKRCRQPACAPTCAPPCGDLNVPCARRQESEAETTIAQAEPEEKTASRPRPSGSPLRFWNPDDDSFSFER